MSCDIHVRLDIWSGGWKNYHRPLFPVRDFDKSWGRGKDDPMPIYMAHRPFNYRKYDMFGFFAGVRGEKLTPISLPRGDPPDYKPEMNIGFGGYEYPAPRNPDRHSHSYLFDHDLTEFDYNTKIDTGETYAEVLGDQYMLHLRILQGLPHKWRIVFDFDC